MRLEAIQIKLSPKTEEATGKSVSTVGVRYQAHVQRDGWQSWVGDGQIGGTTGRALRVEAIGIMVDPGEMGGGIEYQAHVQKIGWQDWAKNGQVAGTSGRSLRVEALRIKLTGDIAETYDVYYRAHVQGIGWLDWAKDGADAGSSGCAFRMEAVEIVLKKKGEAAPGPTDNPNFTNKWDLLEAEYLKKPSTNELLEVKYNGGSSAQIVLRQKQSGVWKTVLSCKGYVGSSGIGTASEKSTKTPQGNFGITKAFGIKSNPGSKLHYVKVTESMYWCSDRAYYNQLIDINAKPHYCTGEHLIDYSPAYDYGLFFDYNTNPVRYGAGSAFFVHCEGRYRYTQGCISMSKTNMVKVIRTIHSGARLLVYSK